MNSYYGGGEDGGGFVGGSQGGSQTARPINDESLRPVTIKQLIDAEQAFGDAPFRIDGVEIKQVTLVGMVRQISPQTTNITYRLDDGTGIIEVKQWLDADKQDNDGAGGSRRPFREEEYVRVWGRLKSFSNKRHVGAHVIKPVADINEVNYHMLESTYVHLFFTKGDPSAAGAGAGAGAGAAGDEDSMFVDSGYGANSDDKTRGYSAKAKKMYNYLNNSTENNEGTNMHVIARDTGMTIQDVMTAAEELLGHGSIYTTLDDETFAILDCY